MMWKRRWSQAQLEAWVKRNVKKEFDRLPKRMEKVYAKAEKLAQRVDTLKSSVEVEDCIAKVVHDSVVYWYMFNMSPEALAGLKGIVKDAEGLQG